MSHPSGLVTVISPSHSGWNSVVANVKGRILYFVSVFGKSHLYCGVPPPYFPLEGGCRKTEFLRGDPTLSSEGHNIEYLRNMVS